MAGYKEYCRACSFHSHIGNNHFCSALEYLIIWQDEKIDGNLYSRYINKQKLSEETWEENCPKVLEYLMENQDD